MKKLVLLFVCLNLSAQVSKVEPPMWWSGMHNTNLMLTLYGDDLAEYEVTSNNLTITDVVRLESKNYLFVYLDLATTKPGSYQLVLGHSQNASIQIPYKLREDVWVLPNVRDMTALIYLPYNARSFAMATLLMMRILNFGQPNRKDHGPTRWRFARHHRH